MRLRLTWKRWGLEVIVNPLDLALFGGPIVRADAGHSRGNWQAKRASKQRQRSVAHRRSEEPNDRYKRYNVQGTPQTKKIGLRMVGEREDRADDFSDEHPLKSLRNAGWGHVGRGMHRNPAHRGHTIQFNTGVGKPASYEHKNHLGTRIGGGHAKTLASHLHWYHGLHRGDAITRRGFLTAGAGGAIYGGKKLAEVAGKKLRERVLGTQDQGPRWSESALVQHQRKAHRHFDVTGNERRMPENIEQIRWKQGYGTRRGDDIKGAAKAVGRRVGGTLIDLGDKKFGGKNENWQRKRAHMYGEYDAGLWKGDAGMGSSPPGSSRRKPDPMAQFSKGHAQHQAKRKRFALIQRQIGKQQRQTVPAGLRG